MSFSFPKKQRLSSKKDIDYLFKSGRTFTIYPFKIIYRHLEKEECSLKLAISVPKKKHRNAVDRNLLKRRIREAYRKNNADLKTQLEKKGDNMHLFLIYLSSEKLPYSQIEDKIILLLQRLEQIDGKIIQ